MCISSTNEGKTQVGWAVAVGGRAQKWANVNNTLPKGSPSHVPDSNEMIERSLCLEALKKYSGNGCA
jgi:hypothetical protein